MSPDQQISFPKNILVVDDDDDFRWVTGNLLRSSGYDVLQAQDGEEALSLLEKDIPPPNIVLLDYRMPGQDGLQIAAEMKQRFSSIPIIMITAYAEVKSAVKAMEMGVYNYIAKPVNNNDLIFAIKRALEKQDLEREIARLRDVVNESASLYEIMGKSDRIRKLVQLVKKVAPTMFTVLIEGESGSGKEIVAHAVHDLSEVKEGPFVAVDCGAIPETLIESELFGYMKGAFTGAHTDKPGQFELADGGTLFLDEVGNLPYSAQQKLLRAMQERVVQRLGARKVRSVQVRIIAASNQPLERDIKTRDFRSDLYFRLKEFTLRIPSLRERKEDIPYLAGRFMDEVQGELHKKCRGFSKEALDSLAVYDWPGNVRELRNAIRQAVLLCEENALIKPDHLMFSPCLMSDARDPAAFDHVYPVRKEFSNGVYDGKKPLQEMVKSVSDELEKKIIKEVIAQTKGNKSAAARRLGIDYKTLLRKIKTHQIER